MKLFSAQLDSNDDTTVEITLEALFNILSFGTFHFVND